MAKKKKMAVRYIKGLVHITYKMSASTTRLKSGTNNFLKFSM